MSGTPPRDAYSGQHAVMMDISQSGWQSSGNIPENLFSEAGAAVRRVTSLAERYQVVDSGSTSMASLLGIVSL